MNTKELKTRDQIDSKYKWNIEAMIPDESVISGELETIKKEAEAYGEDFAGRLTYGADLKKSMSMPECAETKTTLKQNTRPWPTSVTA